MRELSQVRQRATRQATKSALLGDQEAMEYGLIDKVPARRVESDARMAV